MLSRKHYVDIARVIADYRHRSDGEDWPWEGLVQDLCDMMAEDNPRFDRAKFVAACKEQA